MNMEQVLQQAIRRSLAEVRVAIPGTVLSYDHATQKAHVRVAVNDKFQDADTEAITHEEVPVIPNVPVLFARATGYADTFPLTPGDTVWIMFADRSLDEWKSTGNATNSAADVRRFDLSDAVCIPGETSFARPVGVTGRSASARVIEAPSLLLGSSTAIQPPLFGSFETDFQTWLTGFTTFLAAIAADATNPAHAAAAATFTPINTVFVTQVATGHRAAKVKVE